jgi:hypothetical protein
MTKVAIDLERRVLDVVLETKCIGWKYDAVFGAPHDQHRHVDLGQ